MVSIYNVLEIAGKTFNWGQRTYVMGIINLTHDSFSGDGLGENLSHTLAQARAFVAAGADMLDIGGESTNPYHSQPLTLEDELQRVIPAIEAISSEIQIPISIDSYKPEVAKAALVAGAHIINDIHGLENPHMRAIAAETKVPVIIMHMRGTPQTMLQLVDYGGDVVGEVVKYFRQQVSELQTAGISPDKIIIDPGFGFAKNYTQNLELLKGLSAFKELGFPLLAGVSRKGFIGKAMAGGAEALPPSQRLPGTAAANTIAIMGGADIIRVHDVAEMVGVARMADALIRKH